MLQRVKNAISEYTLAEFGHEPDFSDLTNVALAYTTVTDDDLPLQVYVDLVNCKIVRELSGIILDEKRFNSLEELYWHGLHGGIEFDQLVAVSDEDYYEWLKKNGMRSVSTFIEAVQKRIVELLNDENLLHHPLEHTEVSVVGLIMKSYSYTAYLHAPVGLDCELFMAFMDTRSGDITIRRYSCCEEIEIGGWT